jgi:hypothetical protein
MTRQSSVDDELQKGAQQSRALKLRTCQDFFQLLLDGFLGEGWLAARYSKGVFAWIHGHKTGFAGLGVNLFNDKQGMRPCQLR